MSEIEFKEPCGGCGQKYASKRCFGCHHEMMAAAPAPVISAGDLVRRLKSRKGEAITRTEKLMDEAAARIQELEAALKPFAKCASHYVRPGYNMLERVIHIRSVDSNGPTEALLTRGDFAIARFSLNQDGGKP